MNIESDVLSQHSAGHVAVGAPSGNLISSHLKQVLFEQTDPESSIAIQRLTSTAGLQVGAFEFDGSDENKSLGTLDGFTDGFIVGFIDGKVVGFGLVLGEMTEGLLLGSSDG